MVFVKSGGDANQLCNLLNSAMNDLRKQIVIEQKQKQHSNTIKKSTHKTNKSKSQKSQKSSDTHHELVLQNIIPAEYLINPLCLKLEGSSSKDEQSLAINENKYKMSSGFRT